MNLTITTFTGRRFDPFLACPQDLCVQDIAHALSLMTRANGHFPVFYSVAQHSIACCREALALTQNQKTALFCLLHDAAEAYMSDVTRPVKARMPAYCEAEDRLLALIYQTLAGDQPDAQQAAYIRQVDDAMLGAEFKHFADLQLFETAYVFAVPPVLETAPFAQVETEFLQLYSQLSAE